MEKLGVRVVLLDCNRSKDHGSTLPSPPWRSLKLMATHCCQTDVLLGKGSSELAAAGHGCSQGGLGSLSWSGFMFFFMLEWYKMLLARERHSFPCAHGAGRVRPSLAFPLLRMLPAPPWAAVFLHSCKSWGSWWWSGVVFLDCLLALLPPVKPAGK